MLSPPILRFRQVQRSAVLEERVREMVQRLRRFNERIDHCHLMVERLDRGQDGLPGSPPYAVHIDLSIPGAEIHADGTSDTRSEHADVYAALNAAFDDAKRQLQELHRERIEISKR